MDIADAPRAAAASGDQTVTLTTAAAQTIRSVTLIAPAPGMILVNASASVQFTSAGQDLTQCSITTGTGIEFTHQTNMSEGAADNSYESYAAVRAFTVAAGSTTTVNLVCTMFIGTSTLRDSSMTALFVATP